MVRVHANRVAFEIERELTVLDVLQFVFVEIWPAPYAGINHMGKTFASCHLRMKIRRGMGKKIRFINCGTSKLSVFELNLFQLVELQT